MLLKVQKIGDHLTVQIPDDYAKICGFENGRQVHMQLSSDSIVIKANGSARKALTVVEPAQVEEIMRSEMFFG